MIALSALGEAAIITLCIGLPAGLAIALQRPKGLDWMFVLAGAALFSTLWGAFGAIILAMSSFSAVPGVVWLCLATLVLLVEIVARHGRRRS